jgi:CTP:phosphocholine cytidylyltransferase-like protein
MKTKIITFSIILLSIIVTSAQEKQIKTHEKKYSKAIGIGAGFTTGVGLSFRYFPKKYGVQLTAAPYYRDYGKEAFISGGVTLLLSLAENKTNNIYAYFGNHYFYSKLNRYNSTYDPILGYYTSTSKSVTENFINSGIGIGMEIHAQKRITLNAMIGYAQYNSFQTLFFTCEATLFYRFN